MKDYFILNGGLQVMVLGVEGSERVHIQLRKPDIGENAQPVCAITYKGELIVSDLFPRDKLVVGKYRGG